MRASVRREPRSVGRGRRFWQIALPCLVLTLVAVALVAQGCSGGTSATTSGSATTIGSSTSTTPTLPGVGDVDLQQDIASPAQVVLNAVNPSVVNISVTGSAGGQTGTGIGSGVIYTSDGLILTNDHVVTLDGNLSSGQSITVTLSSGDKFPATIVGEDAARDIAAIKVAKTGLKPVTFGKSSGVGLAEWAIVIGSPLDFRNTVSLGIVSGLDRTLQISSTQTLTGLMQIDTPISPGNSGGGCFDAQGHFIGMPELYLPPGSTGAQNIGFAIPSDTVATVAKTLTGR